MDIDHPGANRARYILPEEQEVIINIYKYVEQNAWLENYWNPDTTEDIIAEMPGLNKSSGRMVRDRKSRRRPVSELLDYQTLTAIRRKIYRFFHEVGHGVPTPENILCEVNEDATLPNFTMPTFRRVLRHLKYRHYVTHNRHDLASRYETFSIPVV